MQIPCEVPEVPVQVLGEVPEGYGMLRCRYLVRF